MPLHNPDSCAVRLTQDIDDHVKVEASYGDVLLPSDAREAKHNQFVSAWLATANKIGLGTLRSSLVWARGRYGNSASQTSLLAETVNQRGLNAFFGRAEILQITPDQLDAVTVDAPSDPRWVKALILPLDTSGPCLSGVAIHGASADRTRGTWCLRH